MYRALLLSAALIAGGAGFAQAAAPGYHVTGTIAAPDGGWDYASFDSVHRRLYLSRSDGLTAVDVDSGKVTGHLADGQRTHEPLVLPGGDRILLTNGGTSSARLLDAATGKLIADIPVAPSPDAAMFDPASGLALTFGAKGDVTLIDVAKMAAVGQIAVGGKLEFAAADSRGAVFVNVENAGEIARLDVKAKTVAARYKLAGCEEPSGLAYAPDADVLVAACGNGFAKVVSAKTGAVVATLSIGKGPDAVIYDPKRKLMFIPCGRDAVLEVIDVGHGADAKVVQSVKTAQGARLGAVDPLTGNVYVTAADYTASATPGGKPTMKPGSFHFVVVSPN